MKDFSKICQKYGSSVERKAQVAKKKIETTHPNSKSTCSAVTKVFKDTLIKRYKQWEELSQTCYGEYLPVTSENLEIIL